MLKYLDFIGTVEYDDNAETFYGTVINSNTLISFRGRSVDELKQSFRDAVDTYRDECAREGIDPEKPYSGKIMLRISPALHRRIAMEAAASGESMNRSIERLLTREYRKPAFPAGKKSAPPGKGRRLAATASPGKGPRRRPGSS